MTTARSVQIFRFHFSLLGIENTKAALTGYETGHNRRSYRCHTRPPDLWPWGQGASWTEGLIHPRQSPLSTGRSSNTHISRRPFRGTGTADSTGRKTPWTSSWGCLSPSSNSQQKLGEVNWVTMEMSIRQEGFPVFLLKVTLITDISETRNSTSILYQLFLYNSQVSLFIKHI